jgi:asparagine synthase (glutamine-hydrolysing)
MVDDVLVKVDRASMLVALEVRAPLLARPIIEFAFGELPDRLRLNGTARKVIMRRLAARYLPSTLDITRKQGFSIPLGLWISTRWKDLAVDLIGKDDDLLSLADVRPMLQSAPNTQYDADRVFAILALQLWRREHGLL